ncbi:MAG: Fe-S cluster assembly protein SufD [Halobacteriovoraceae bacterium]|jgi:Fe-S cluster assembly protein SufD|nr:Fe-S cluster assembly protein SufD [Halobacteriovoraceae bacterium]
MKNISHYQNEIGKSAKTFKGLATLQKKGLERLEKLEIPTRKNEDWKYTNLAPMLENNYQFKVNQTTAFPKDYISLDENFDHFYFLDGVLQNDISDKTTVTASALHELSENQVQHFSQDKHYFKNDFSHVLNQAALSNGYLFKVKKNDQCTKPVICHYYFSTPNSHINITNYYQCDENSQLNILEIFHSRDPLYINLSNNVFLEQTARFYQTTIQDCHQDSLYLQNTNTQVRADAHFENVHLTIGAKVSRTNLYTDLQQEGAGAQIHGLYSLQGDQHNDTMSYTKHSAPHTHSNQLYKGILKDNSKGIFTGRVRVQKEAQQITAGQLNKNLLLSPKAHTYSRPQLEIFADDVKCTHGSTTGQLSHDQLFYFQARGISKDKAMLILANAFSNDVLFKITNRIVRDFSLKYLAQKKVTAHD